MLAILKIFILFIIYSFLGYLAEVIWCSIESKKIVNRGFLVGPLCPIYGVGAITLSLLLSNYYNNMLIVFVFGVIIASIIEYFIGYMLEKIFHNKWWDYSNQFGNINGHVCLLNSLAFGVGALVIVYLVHPFLTNAVDSFSNTFTFVAGILLLIVFVHDCVYSLRVAYNLRINIIVVEDLKHKKIKDITNFLEQNLRRRIKKLFPNPDRLLKSFPNLKKGMVKEFEAITKIGQSLKLEIKRIKIEKKLKKKEKN